MTKKREKKERKKKVNKNDPKKRKKEKEKASLPKKINVADEVQCHTRYVAHDLLCQLNYLPYCLVGGKETIY